MTKRGNQRMDCCTSPAQRALVARLVELLADAPEHTLTGKELSRALALSASNQMDNLLRACESMGVPLWEGERGQVSDKRCQVYGLLDVASARLAIRRAA